MAGRKGGDQGVFGNREVDGLVKANEQWRRRSRREEGRSLRQARAPFAPAVAIVFSCWLSPFFFELEWLI
ncbi:hypothetical protein NL676_032807 [Syzygium grande]|nr:hypothetical protein NL676_032807 [Syzygium grande]